MTRQYPYQRDIPLERTDTWPYAKAVAPAQFDPSPQQQDLITWVLHGKGSAFVEAVAGAGKSTSLRQVCRVMRGNVVICAFNKKIAREMEDKLIEDGLNPSTPKHRTNLRVGTIHSLGYGMWRKAHPNVKLDVDLEVKKPRQMLEALNVPEELHAIVIKLVNFARQSGVLLYWQPEDRSEWFKIIEHHDMIEMLEQRDRIVEAIEYAEKGVLWYREHGNTVIDFEDMVWLPAVSDLAPFQYDWVLVDEAQDTNPSRRALVRKMLRPHGRAIFVGDRHQAIYGFTGADNDAIDRIIKDFNCTRLPLTVTYRCPRAVVELAHSYVDHIEAHETAPQGSVTDLDAHEFHTNVMRTLRPGDAILCRNTKPIVSLAFTLIRNKIACHVEGRDIGQGLITLAKKYESRNIDTWRHKLEEYRDREVAKLTAKGKETMAQSVTDKVDTLLVIGENSTSVKKVIETIEALFEDAPDGAPTKVTLSTVHKAKGREWDKVFVLGFAKYMPSKWARQQWQQEQETNVIYVAVTRAKQSLILLEALD